MSLLFLFFVSLGVAYVAWRSVPVLYVLYAYFLRRPIDLKSRYGSWAIVTGGTDGIGNAIAFELARKNLNLILIGRNPDKLKSVSARISDECRSVRVKSVVIDLSEDLVGPMAMLRSEIEGLDVGVLVNNAGATTPYSFFFHEEGMDTWTEIINVNLRAATEVTRVVVEGMVARGRGAIVNIGSAAGSDLGVPILPLFDVYAATKAYLEQFTRSLSVEYKNKGIDVQCQMPMVVETKFGPGGSPETKPKTETSEFDPISLVAASPESYARSAVRFIGFEQRCIPYFSHFLQCCLLQMLPEFILHPLVLYASMCQKKMEQISTMN